MHAQVQQIDVQMVHARVGHRTLVLVILTYV